MTRVAKQRRLLADYREKLRGSWRTGSVLEAGAARRAADFVRASSRAEQQIEQMERQAHQQLEFARHEFAQSQERRRGLAAAKQAVVLAETRTTDQRMERAQPLTPPKRWRSE